MTGIVRKGWEMGQWVKENREFHAGNIIQNSFIQKVRYFLFYIKVRRFHTKFHAKLAGNTDRNVRKGKEFNPGKCVGTLIKGLNHK